MTYRQRLKGNEQTRRVNAYLQEHRRQEEKQVGWTLHVDGQQAGQSHWGGVRRGRLVEVRTER